ncbi:hypothetical protein swp_4778 [Shewanella piezotolerans WP3]|uniref:Uncharacterized protein n=1 Tax=Shewanella piezotolerans (strain WP3 / JCM 13877) TaxID=225849 RepID=B8CUT2_SHEPW|nr:hypothetical protein swp_4778 [Shewanella piezotolerans WP3]
MLKAHLQGIAQAAIKISNMSSSINPISLVTPNSNQVIKQVDKKHKLAYYVAFL